MQAEHSGERSCRSATRSCDACRASKVRCIKTGPHGCERCSLAGSACTTSRKKGSRPFYQTSKEQYNLITAALRYFVPDISLETAELRKLVSSLTSQEPRRPSVPARTSLGTPLGDVASSLDCGPTTEDRCALEQSGKLRDPPSPDGTERISPLSQAHQTFADFRPPSAGEIFDFSTPLHTGTPNNHVEPNNVATEHDCSIVGQSPSSSTPTDVDETIIVHETTSTSRVHGATSFASFYTKAKSILGQKRERLLQKQPDLTDEIKERVQVEVEYPNKPLPPRAQLEQAAVIFFTEVNSVIYIMTYEGFQECVESIYTRRVSCSNASFAIIYTLMSLFPDPGHLFTSACQYLQLAIEEGSIETVQALMLMTLCCLNRDHRNLAWIHIGTAVRVAQSLGLHMDERLWQGNSQLQIEHRRRLWWSLYDMEAWLAQHMGRPSGIDDTFCTVAIPSVADLSQVPHTPCGYTGISAQLSQHLKRFTSALRSSTGNPDEYPAKIRGFLVLLEHWWDQVPPYFKSDQIILQPHTRAIKYLRLRYLHAIMIITRSYLLPAGMAPIDDLSTVCETANRESLLLLQDMCHSGLLSRLDFQDVHYILASGMILFVRSLVHPCEDRVANIEQLFTLLSLTDHVSLGRIGIRSMRTLLEGLKEYCKAEKYCKLWAIGEFILADYDRHRIGDLQPDTDDEFTWDTSVADISDPAWLALLRFDPSVHASQ